MHCPIAWGQGSDSGTAVIAKKSPAPGTGRPGGCGLQLGRDRRSAPLGPSPLHAKNALDATQERGWEGGGRLPGAPDLRRDAAGSPQVSQLSPPTQDRGLQAPPSWKSQEVGGQPVSPAKGPGRRWPYSRRHPLDSRQKPTEKRHTSSSGVSVGLRGK